MSEREREGETDTQTEACNGPTNVAFASA